MTMLDPRPDLAAAPEVPPTRTASTTDRPKSAADAPASTPAPRTSRTPRVDRLMRVLHVVGILGAVIVGVIGFAASYTTLEEAARAWGFGVLSPAFPIGIDASILAFIALDLVMVYRGTPWPVLRIAGHGMVAVTVVLNASAHGGLSLSARSLSHAAMPVLFVIATEAARRMAVHAVKLAAGHDTIPFVRWALAPSPTFKLWRRMKLWELHSYSQAVKTDQGRESYRAYLEWKDALEAGDEKSARVIADRMPFRMAPYGLTTEEALLVLEAEEHAAAERDRAATERKEAAALAEKEAAAARKQRSAAAEVTELHADHAVDRARIQLGADIDSAQAAATAQTEAARTAAEATAQAFEDEAATAALRKAAEHRKATADANKKAADAEAATADAKRRTADDKLAAADAERRAAALTKAAADDRKAAADADRLAADARRAAVDAEDAAREAEARLNLTDQQRKARLVARTVIQHFGGDVDAMPVEAVQELLGGASHGTAQKRRVEAGVLIAEGYRG
ncbi:DUF2637 domain-containing protein [Streptomyces sp. NPDC059650]|uniref:DUF2637 domain-containing protein n=1 Tax=Streptomyces sp. NPDC059650 TaxID=3346896 RepID=UPI003682F9DB